MLTVMAIAAAVIGVTAILGAVEVAATAVVYATDAATAATAATAVGLSSRRGLATLPLPVSSRNSQSVAVIGRNATAAA